MFSLIMCCILLAWSVSYPVKAIPKRSDDINLAELQHVIQQQSAVIQTLQAKVTSMDHTMQTMQSKLMNHVAFTANTQGPGEATIGHREVIKFSKITTNSGGGYSATSGVFTASVAGTYGFYLSIRHDFVSAWIVVALEKNGKEICYAVAQNGKEVTNGKGSCFATSHLNVGDKVLARQNDGDTHLELWRFTTFSGFLLLAD